MFNYPSKQTTSLQMIQLRCIFWDNFCVFFSLKIHFIWL